ncbi:MAG TPA: ABC transporter ATP-binding protein [bacterium]|nr:ABC transporter ATP-binding protein [bacterium]
MSIHEEETLGKAYDSRLMRRLMGFLRPYRWSVLLAVAVLIAGSLIELAGPYLTRIAIDNHIRIGDVAGLQHIALLYFLLLVGQAIITYTTTWLTQRIGQRIMYDMRMSLFSHLQKLPLSYFDRNPVGRLITRVTNDVETLNNMLSSGVVTIFGDLFVLIGIIVAMMLFHWRLASLTLLVLPLILYTSFLFRTHIRDSFRQVRLRIARINSYLQENITAITTVQLFSREAKNSARFDELNRDHLQAYLKTIFYYAVFYPVIELIMAVSIGLILWYGGLQVIDQTLTLGVLVAFLQYVQRFFMPIRDLSEKFNLLQSAMAASERIFGVLDTPIQDMGPVGLAPMPPARGEIQFQRVSFGYHQDHLVLKDVNFTIKPGEKVAVVGATGAGKTSLINLINRLYEPTAGTVFLDGVNTLHLPLDDLRRRIRMVLQEVFIFSGTVEYNIRLGDQNIPMDRVLYAAQEVHAHDFIVKLPDGYQTELSERGSNLSVGQKQLLSFARALCFDPEILILDEATSSVDTETEGYIRDAIQVLMKGRTSIIIAHRLSTIQDVDWILVLHKGEIREMGTHAELLGRKGIYHRLYQLQYDLEGA